MSDTAAYVAIAVGALAILAIGAVVVLRRDGSTSITPLAGLALGCVVCGIVFGDDRVVGYGFFAAGITLAVIDTCGVRGTRAHPGGMTARSRSAFAGGDVTRVGVLGPRGGSGPAFVCSGLQLGVPGPTPRR